MEIYTLWIDALTNNKLLVFRFVFLLIFRLVHYAETIAWAQEDILYSSAPRTKQSYPITQLNVC